MILKLFFFVHSPQLKIYFTVMGIPAILAKCSCLRHINQTLLRLTDDSFRFLNWLSAAWVPISGGLESTRKPFSTLLPQGRVLQRIEEP